MESPTSYLFRLREGIRWQTIDPVGGRELTSEDVSFSYVRQSQPGLPNAPLLQNVDTVQPLAPLELRVTLKSPDADALSLLADGHTKVVAREAVEVTGDLRDGPTVGTGPWVLERTVPNDSHSFSRNPDYFEPGLPLLDGLRVHILPDAKTRAAAFGVGILDVHQMQPDEWLTYLQREPSAPAKLIRQPGIGLEVALNGSRPPFDDARVRQAVFLAMDPLKAIDEHWGGFAFVSTGFPVEGADWLPTATDIGRFLNRPADARALLQDAGITDAIPVTIKVGDFGEAYLAHAKSMAREMAAVGFAPEVELVNRRDFGENVWLGGDYQMFAGPTAPVAAPNGFLLPVLHSNGIWNTTGHRDKVLDDLLEKQAISTDPVVRSQVIGEIRERVLLKAYRFMPAARVAIWTWRPRVIDFYPNFAGFEYYHWARVWLDS
jgi:peptide/nickel transport system substrate-binding protein